MLANCANPQCDQPVHYLRDGTLHALYTLKPTGANGEMERSAVEFFWLCADCSAKMTLRFKDGRPQFGPRAA